MWPFGIVAYAEWQFTEGILPPTPLSWYTAADDTYERARSWISDCLTDHNDCQRSVVQFSLPTRLVHISQEPQKLRLVLGEQLTPNTEYLALSYCWGTDVFETSCLKEHNLESFSQCIPFDTLPKTIQDAIVITRRLGYSYIWIDRLCIIQDSQFDWLNESYSMGKYYHNSTCSIAAMDAASSTEGCFAHRNPLYFQVCAVETDSDKRIFLHLLDNSPTKGPFMADGATALTSRAWVVQERFLSARTIYYGRDGIYWECRMHTWSQTETNLYTTRKAQSETPLRRDYKYRGRAVVGGSQKGTLYKLFNPLDSVSARMNFQIAWDCLVNYYTRCAMTCSTDRLMAIMGIIILVDSRMSLKSSAGLWHHFLPTQLLWRRALPVRRGPLELGERIQNKAPTWSWGSIPGTI
ncbi:HET-domain-containing protein, partial [Stipitochalara longipes BDJ]